MAIMVLDPYVEEHILAERVGTDGDQYDEVWEGVYVYDAVAKRSTSRHCLRARFDP